MKKIWIMTLILTGLTAGSLHAQDFGDFSSATLTGKAWEAFGKNNDELALVYIERCVDMYLKTAREQQASLSEFAAADNAHDYWALNDVGTSLFIKGQILERQEKNEQAIAAYRQLVNELGFAQCWDTNGWFWRPAEAAAARLRQMEFDALLD